MTTPWLTRNPRAARTLQFGREQQFVIDPDGIPDLCEELKACPAHKPTPLYELPALAQRLGVGVLLVAVPLVMAAGFLWLALAPVFGVFVVVMVARRAGEYAFVRPGREMLYTVVAPGQKYKAKNFIDTVVYRGGDALSGWVKRALDVLAEHPAVAMLIGTGVALAWAATGVALGRQQRRREEATSS